MFISNFYVQYNTLIIPTYDASVGVSPASRE